MFNTDWILDFNCQNECRIKKYLIFILPTKNHFDIKFQVNNEILPIGIYASMICMIFVTLTTDWLRYKIVIVIQALCGVGIYTLLSVCTSFMSAIVSINYYYF